MSVIVQQAIVLALGGVAVSLLVLRLARSGRLSARFALGWLGVGAMIVSAAAFLPFVERLGNLANMTPTAVLLSLSSATLLAISIQLSSMVSASQERVRTLSEWCALHAQHNTAPVNNPSSVAQKPLVVIPAYNESGYVQTVVKSVIEAGYDCVVIDDGSTDATSSLVNSMGVTCLTMPINVGVGGALRTGFSYAVNNGYTSVVQVDADGQHLASEIQALVDAAHHSEASLVLGTRFGTTSGYEMSRVRRSCVRILAAAVARNGIRVTDPTSGFRLIREPLLSEFSRSFPAHYLGDTFESLVVAGRRGYSVTEVSVTMIDRQAGRPSADLYALVRAMIRSLMVAVIGPSFDIKRHGN